MSQRVVASDCTTFVRPAFSLSAVAIALALSSQAAEAGTIVFSGKLNDATNTALKSSTLGAASFTSASDIANNVALYTFTLSAGGPVSISTSDGTAGVDPYFTLFKGTTNTATFAASNYDHAFQTGGDFTLPLTLAAGSYTIALGAFANMSFAENSGSGTLGDGFIGLGETYSVGSGFYQVNVTAAAVPEPATTALLLAGLVAVGGRARRATRPAA